MIHWKTYEEGLLKLGENLNSLEQGLPWLLIILELTFLQNSQCGVKNHRGFRVLEEQGNSLHVYI